MDKKRLLDHEKDFSLYLSVAFVGCIITGLVTFFYPGFYQWLQWTALSHITFGIGFSIVLLPYTVIHFKRTAGFRRPLVFLLGVLTLTIIFPIIGTGGYIAITGSKETEISIYWIHVIASLLAVFALILHLIFHVLLMPAKRKDLHLSRFPSLPYGFSKKVGLSLLFGGLCIALASALSTTFSVNSSEESAIENYQYSYGPHPFRPSQTEVVGGGFVDKNQVAQSHQCYSCHEEIAEQWYSSVHRQAASDPTYVTNVSLLADKKGIAATRYCEGCHAPVALLSGELTPGGVHGGIEGSRANIEGISCLGCHGIISLVHLKGVASYEFSPVKEYLFQNSPNNILKSLNHLLIRVNPDQHKRDMGKALFKKPEFCATCHAQFMDKDMNDWGWVKMQDEYSAWLKSPFSKQHQGQFSSGAAQRCQDCHMPLVAANDPSADKNGMVRSHSFPGANTFLPLLNGDQQHFELVKKFLQSNRIRLSIERPSRNNAQQTLHAVDESIRDYQESSTYFYIGEKPTLNVTVSNNGVGHDFPGGAIDINEVWVEFRVSDAEGDVVYQSGMVLADNQVDPEAHFYRSLPIDREGRLVWQHDLFNMVGESFRRVIKSGESDIANYNFDVPAWAKSPLTITAKLKYRKLNDRYARWALKDKYFELPIIDIAWDSLSIPVRDRLEVE